MVGALESLWHHGQLLVLDNLSLSSRLLNPAERGGGIGWMKEDLNDVNFLSIGVEHLLSSLLSNSR